MCSCDYVERKINFVSLTYCFTTKAQADGSQNREVIGRHRQLLTGVLLEQRK